MKRKKKSLVLVAYQKGYSAKLREERNRPPYPLGDELRGHWIDGYAEAEYGESNLKPVEEKKEMSP